MFYSSTLDFAIDLALNKEVIADRSLRLDIFAAFHRVVVEYSHRKYIATVKGAEIFVQNGAQGSLSFTYAILSSVCFIILINNSSPSQ